MALAIDRRSGQAFRLTIPPSSDSTVIEVWLGTIRDGIARVSIEAPRNVKILRCELEEWED